MGEASNRPLNHSPNKPIVAHLACEGMLPNPKGIVVGLLVADRRDRGERPVKKRGADEEKRTSEEGGREGGGRWRKDSDGPKVAPACRARLCSSLFPVNVPSSFHRCIHIRVHVNVVYTYTRITTPVKRDAVLVDRRVRWLRFFYDNT